MTSASMTSVSRAPLAGITVLGLEQAIAAPLCTRHLAELDELLGGWCAGLGLAEIQRRADAAGIGNARLNGVGEAIRAEVSGQHAQRILLLARTAPRTAEKPLDGMTLFFTDLDRTRITVRAIDKLGRPAVDSNELFIDDLEVPDEDVVGEPGHGFRYLLDGLNPERTVVGVEGVGIGRAALDLAARYARERVVFDRPIGKNQAIAHPLADAWIQLEAAELMAMKAAALYDARRPCGKESNAAKYLGAEAGFQACDRALQTAAWVLRGPRQRGPNCDVSHFLPSYIVSAKLALIVRLAPAIRALSCGFANSQSSGHAAISAPRRAYSGEWYATNGNLSNYE
jgi:alkylation response protein AidB-like acyl-CoA dehydrogenase